MQATTMAKPSAKELLAQTTEVKGLFSSKPSTVAGLPVAAYAGKPGFTTFGEPLWPGAVDAYKADEVRQAASQALLA